MKNPFFSIMLPTYNRADFLPVSVNSILQQTFTEWELIIVDDGSIDNAQRVIKKFKDPHSFNEVLSMREDHELFDRI